MKGSVFFFLLFPQFKRCCLKGDSGLGATSVQRPTLLYFGDADWFKQSPCQSADCSTGKVRFHTLLDCQVMSPNTSLKVREGPYWLLADICSADFVQMLKFLITSDNNVCRGFRPHRIFLHMKFKHDLLLLWCRTKWILQIVKNKNTTST